MNIDSIMKELAEYIRMQEEAAIKRDMPEVAARYTKTTTTHKFTFA